MDEWVLFSNWKYTVPFCTLIECQIFRFQAAFNLMVPKPRPKPAEELTVLVIVERPEHHIRDVITMVQVRDQRKLGYIWGASFREWIPNHKYSSPNILQRNSPTNPKTESLEFQLFSF